jgi:hypothetical protein
MTSNLKWVSCVLAIVCGSAVPEQEAAVQGAASSGGGPGGGPSTGPGPSPSPGPLPYAVFADCDGDGVKDCWISKISISPYGYIATQITLTHPVTHQQVTEVICNGDYNGKDEQDPDDDEPCNAPICVDPPQGPPQVSFPPSADGPCDVYSDAVGEVCVGWGGGRVCDCIFPDPTSETGLSPTYPDDTNGDGVNDCPP